MVKAIRRAFKSRLTQTVDQLYQAALNLSDEEQLQLVAALTSPVEEPGIRPFDDSWRDEIERRSSEYDAADVQPIPWSQVKQRARQQVFGNG